MAGNLSITQIIYLTLRPDPHLKLKDSQIWTEALDHCEQSSDVKRLYWGRSLEHPEHAQLHIVRESLQQHHDFLKSENFKNFLSSIKKISVSPSEATIRHALLRSWTPKDRSLARGAPFTGTAIYYDTTDAWDQGAWPLWTHIVRHVDGCLGCAGGPLLEPVETVPGPLGELMNRSTRPKTFQRCYIVYVGWETTEKHHEYHRTGHFEEHNVILRCGNEGFAEYGHIVFEGSRERDRETEAKL